MPIATKNRRKISVTGREFIWYVSDAYDSADKVLRVASEDKKFVVNYHLGQPDDTRFLIILGKEFNGLPEKRKGWIRVLCPQWEEDSIIKPSSVRRLIEWCFEKKADLVEVDWLGKPFHEINQTY